MMKNFQNLFTSLIDECIKEKISLRDNQHINLNDRNNVGTIQIDSALTKLSNDFEQISYNLMDLRRIVSRTKESLKRR